MKSIQQIMKWCSGLLTWKSSPLPNNKTELVKLISRLSRDNILDKETVPMVQGILSLSETRASEIMIPQARMKVVDKEDRIEEALKLISESGHSRFPVVNGSKDNVLGIVLAKEILGFFSDHSSQTIDKKRFVWNDFIRTPSFVPENKLINTLLAEFKKSRSHMVIVINEYGGVSGLVTIEDVLEQIVGDIADESDSFSFKEIIMIDRRHYIIHPHTLLSNINKKFDFKLESNAHETISGYIFEKLGRMAKSKDIVKDSYYQFEVVKATKRDIERIRLTLPDDD